MARDAVRGFIQAVNESEDLRSKVQKALDGSSGPASFARLAKDNGFEFSEADATAFFAETLEVKQPDELGDADLEKVAGGAKDSPLIRTALFDVVNLFKGARFSSPPSWTGFRF